MTQSAHRRRLVPKTAIVAGIVIILVIALAAAASVLVARSRLVSAPNLVGASGQAAEKALADTGLLYQVSAVRVSVDVASGRVIEQDPPAGTLLKPGAVVGVVLSVGPQSFPVPDLVGRPFESARDELVALGLSVVTEAASADTTEAIVLAMYPAPGATVSPGDEIRLTVPGGSGQADALLPYQLDGVTVLIDPQPAPAEALADAPMEVARRLQALFEAAGATVQITWGGTGVAASPDARTAAAAASSADLFVGIDVGSSGVAGITVSHLPSANGGARAQDSLAYARSITRAATLPELVVNEPAQSFDPVLGAFPGTGVRVVVGDVNAEADRARFGDPAWADQVARAIYRGVGTTLEGS